VIVVADTFVILNLTLIGCDTLLKAMFGVVIVPPAVESEFQRLSPFAFS
jgi:predicted nucleic acid-binding protein